MGRIVVSEFVTLDGVMEDPGGAEGFAHGGWAFTFERGPDGDKFKLDKIWAPTPAARPGHVRGLRAGVAGAPTRPGSPGR